MLWFWLRLLVCIMITGRFIIVVTLIHVFMSHIVMLVFRARSFVGTNVIAKSSKIRKTFKWNHIYLYSLVVKILFIHCVFFYVASIEKMGNDDVQKSTTECEKKYIGRLVIKLSSLYFYFVITYVTLIRLIQSIGQILSIIFKLVSQHTSLSVKCIMTNHAPPWNHLLQNHPMNIMKHLLHNAGTYRWDL